MHCEDSIIEQGFEVDPKTVGDPGLGSVLYGYGTHLSVPNGLSRLVDP